MTINCLADEIAESHEHDAEEFEQILRDLVTQGRKLEVSHYAFAQSRLGLDQKKANDEYRRMTRVVNLLNICGTPEQQQSKREAAKVAAEVALKEVPKHRAKAEEHTAKADAYERDQRLAEKAVEHTDEALSKLPEVAPGYLRKRVSQAESLFNSHGLGKELRDAVSRQHELKVLLNFGNILESQDRHLDALRRLCRDAVSQQADGRMLRFSYSPAWPGIKADAEREFAELTTRIPALQEAYDAELAKIRRPLVDYFMNPEEND